MEGSAALQNAMRRRLRREAATLNVQQTASLSFDAENVNYSVWPPKFVDGSQTEFPQATVVHGHANVSL